jgi:SAM-dependent methyltransferase
MSHLLPPTGQRLLEIGAGFGRLADLYTGYSEVILLDYARTQLEEAQDFLGPASRFIYVVGDVYNLPFSDNVFDTLTMVRVMHHLTEVGAALMEIQRLLKPQGMAVIEYANKRHLKSIARWLLRRQSWSPFNHEPIEFVEMNFNFHPTWMKQQFGAAGLTINQTRTLSHYRIGLLKRLIPAEWLIQLDAWAQPSGNLWQLTPSVMVQAQAHKTAAATPSSLFRCPNCHAQQLYLTAHETGQLFMCGNCHYGWSYRDGIYDFKTPLVPLIF